MVVDTSYYDTLGVEPTATELQIKKAYRKLAITTHPDKNPGDETAHARFQAIGEAYQVLSDPHLRQQYDKFGKEQAQPGAGFEDPSEFFTMIFGGDAFKDIIGEISIMKDITKTMELTQQQAEEDDLAETTEEKLKVSEDSGTAHDTKLGSPPPYSEMPSASASAPSSSVPSGTTTPKPRLGQQMLTNKTDDDAREEAKMDAAGLTPEEKEVRRKERRKQYAKQREQLAQFEKERQAAREERVAMLAKKLIDRISVWTETDRGPDVTRSFQKKIQLEVEELKMESFGLEILHAVGTTYLQRATTFLKSQKTFGGVTGFFSRLKEKGAFVKETWGIISTAIDAQMTMEEMSRLEEKGGDLWTDEKKAEYERKVTGKILAAAWKGSKYEIQSVLRDVCDKVLYDKSVWLHERIERAQAMVLVGTVYQKAERSPDEEGEYMAFEELMAEAAAKKGKEKDESGDKSKKHFFRSHNHSSSTTSEPKADGSPKAKREGL